MDNDLSKIRSFEIEIDQTLESLPSIQCEGEDCINLASRLIEECYSVQGQGFADNLIKGLNILAPYFLKSRSRESPELEQLISDLDFAAHYYMLREYLYYTYNSPGSFSWVFDGAKVEIKFNDVTIPRQFFIQANNYFLGSIDIFSNYDTSEQIVDLLRGQDEFSILPQIEKAYDLIEKETALKLDSYYNFLPANSEIDLGDYKYNQFYEVFKSFVTKALYHRYHCRANGVSGPILMPFDGLIRDLTAETKFSSEVCTAIIRDLSYSTQTAKEGVQPVYFSLYHLTNCNQVIMMPHHFATWEGLISFLRVLALRRPKLFLETISTPLSDGFLNHVESLFLKQGFRCMKNVQLNKFHNRLPDIDLLVISEEPTFGYFLYCCEVKNPIPPQWAKDHLRVLNKDSIAKAFEQMDLITEFLGTETGILFLRSLLPESGLSHFGDQFLIGCSSLIITSRNAGMFFADRNHTIIDYQTLDRILERCDGDVTYISQILKDIPGLADASLRITPVDCLVGSRTVSYEVVQIKQLVEFQQNEYKSTGIEKIMAEEFIKDGRHPFDAIKSKLEE